MARLREQFYFRSIDRRWRKAILAARRRVLVFSPYITSDTADLVLACTSPSKCEVHTVLSAESLAAGASSIRTLKNLLKSGIAIYEIAELHAKVIIVDDDFVSIGSQNLTRKAVTNLEATVAVSERSEVAAIIDLVQPWLEARTIVTEEMLEDFEIQIAELQKEIRKTRRKAANIDAAIREAAVRRARESRATTVRQKLMALVGNGEVSEDTAKDFVACSAWWLRRPSPVRAFRHADNVKNSNRGWYIKFGANTFFVGLAIERCGRTIENALDEVVAGRLITLQDLEFLLYSDVIGSVAKFNGDEYKSGYPVKDSKMKFGTQAIDVDDFIREFLRRLPLSELFLGNKR